jgi:hypothetical protein
MTTTSATLTPERAAIVRVAATPPGPAELLRVPVAKNARSGLLKSADGHAIPARPRSSNKEYMCEAGGHVDEAGDTLTATRP